MKKELQKKALELARKGRPAFESEIDRLNASSSTNDGLIDYLKDTGQIK